jgi:hypothetical protein
VEAHAEDVEEGSRLRRTCRRSGRWRVCSGKLKGLGFRGSDIFKKKNSSEVTDMMTSLTPVTTMVMPIAAVVMSVAAVVMPVAIDF